MDIAQDGHIVWLVALGIGMLIGAERERSKGAGPGREPAGIRTFSVASLLGAAATFSGGPMLLGIATVGVTLLVAIAYLRSPIDDPGLTTELALILTVVLGGVAMKAPEVAAAIGVVTAILLAARAPLQAFVSRTLTPGEVKSALIFAAATLVIWPVLPDRAIDPLHVLNPSSIWAIVVFVMAIGACGHILVRLLGPGQGLPIAGFASGFVSSSATIAAMGEMAARDERLARPAVAGAVLSTVATVLQAVGVLAAVSPVALQAAALPLALAGAAALGYGAVFGLRREAEPTPAAVPEGEAFRPLAALSFALLLAAVLLLSAGLRQWFGNRGLSLAVGLAGFADVHAPTASIATLVAAGDLAAADGVVPFLIAFTANSITKMVLAVASGSRAYWVRVVPGLLIVLAAAWIGYVAQA